MSYDQTASTRSRIQPRSPPSAFSGASGGHDRRRLAEPDDERQQRDVERAEDGRHPRLQAVLRVDPRERRDRGQDDPDGDEQQAAALQDLRECGIEHDDEGEDHPERRERRVAGALEKLEGLHRGEDRDQRDRGRQDHPAEEEDDQQDRNEHGRTDRSLSHGPPARPVSARSGDGGWRTREARCRRRRDRSPARGSRTSRTRRRPTARSGSWTAAARRRSG